MEKCLFPWCIPKASDLPSQHLWDGESKSCSKHSPVRVDGDGVMQIPKYQVVRRESCRLLQASWAQDWDEVLSRCVCSPDEATLVTKHSGRTALHLATFNRNCPLTVARALLKANRHMVLVQDTNWYTPLHIVCFFSGETLVKLFCDTAIMVEQELQGNGTIPLTSVTSPLFLAAKRAAPLGTLRFLLDTRSRTEWIAPSTGGEPYWMDTLDEYSSPLEILLRGRTPELWSSLQGTNPKILQRMKELAQRRVREVKGITAPEESTTEIVSPIMEEDHLYLPDGSKIETDLGGVVYNEDAYALSLWVKCIELLAEYTPTIQNSETERGTLHAIVCAKVPLLQLVHIALKVFPEQALLRDEQGLLPLHHALLAKHPYTTNALVSVLLRHSPEAVHHRVPDHGQLPLHLAIDLEHPGPVLDSLLRADSHNTLCEPDPLSGLYPFALAASRGYDADTIYSLLTANPQVLAHCQAR